MSARGKIYFWECSFLFRFRYNFIFVYMFVYREQGGSVSCLCAARDRVAPQRRRGRCSLRGRPTATLRWGGGGSGRVGPLPADWEAAVPCLGSSGTGRRGPGCWTARGEAWWAGPGPRAGETQYFCICHFLCLCYEYVKEQVSKGHIKRSVPLGEKVDQ